MVKNYIFNTFLKACLFFALFLPNMLAAQEINIGLNDTIFRLYEAGEDESIVNVFATLNEFERQSPFNLIIYTTAITNLSKNKPHSYSLMALKQNKFANGYLTLLRGDAVSSKKAFHSLLQSNATQSVVSGYVGLIEAAIYCSNMIELKSVLDDALKSKLAQSSENFRILIMAYNYFYKSMISDYSNWGGGNNEFEILNLSMKTMIVKAMTRYFIWNGDIKGAMANLDLFISSYGQIASAVLVKSEVINLKHGPKKAQEYLKSSLDRNKPNPAIVLQILINNLQNVSESSLSVSLRDIIKKSKEFREGVLTELELINLLLDYRMISEATNLLTDVLSVISYPDEFFLFNIISAKMAKLSGNSRQYYNYLAMAENKYAMNRELLWFKYEISFYEEDFSNSDMMIGQLMKIDPYDVNLLFQKYILYKKHGKRDLLEAVVNEILLSDRYISDTILLEIKRRK